MKKTTLLVLLLITEVALGQSEKWTSLFDGKSLAGWHNYNKTGEISNKWVVEEASIHLTGSGGGDLVSDAEFENFVLEIEWKISEGGNSGVMWGVQEDKKYFAPWVTGPEMQVLDDAKHPPCGFRFYQRKSQGVLHHPRPAFLGQSPTERSISYLPEIGRAHV